jgi:hypothetical protein
MRKKPDLDGLKAETAAVAAPKIRKPWKKPEIVELSIRQTKGGIITTTFEGPFNVFFGS